MTTRPVTQHASNGRDCDNALDPRLTGSRGQPLKIAKYLAEAERFKTAVEAYRATKPAAAAEPPHSSKPKRWPRPPAERPTEIPGWPLNPSPPAEIPDFETMAMATNYRQRTRKLGARLPIKPIGPPELRKAASDLRTWRTAE